MNLIFSFFKRHGRSGFHALLAGSALWSWWEAVNRAWAAVGFRYAHNYAEPVVAAVILRIPQNPLLYHNFQNEPFIINPYNPLYFYLSYAGSLLLGAPMAGGRLISWIAGIAACVLIYLILRGLGIGRTLGILSAALLVHLPVAAGQWTTLRPDFTALAFSLGGLTCFLEHERRREAADAHRFGLDFFYWAGILLSFLAYFTKQNFLAGAAGYFLYLLAERRVRDAVRFGVLFGLTAAVPTLLWNHATDDLYLLNQQMSVQKPFYGFLFLRFWKNFILDYGPLLIIAAGGLFFCFRRGRTRMIGLYFLLTLAASVTLGKVGADTNYFVEMTAVVCVLFGIFFGRVLRESRRLLGRGLITAACALAVLQGLMIAGAWPAPSGWMPDLSKLAPRPAATMDTTEFDRLTDFLKKSQGPVFAENMGLLIAAGKPIVYEPFEFTQLAAAGVWDERKILDKIDRGDFDVVLLETNLWRVARSSRFSAAFVERLRRSYRPVGRIAGQIVCAPVKRPE